MRRYIPAVLLLGACLAFAGCPQNNQVLLPPPGSTPVPGILYVGNGGSGSLANRGKIFVYGLPVNGASSPNFTLIAPHDGSSKFESFAFDSSNVYVADCGDHLVRVFARPLTSSSTQAFVIAAPGPDGIAIDSAGNLYSGNDCAPSTITVYAPPLSASSTASVTVTDASNFIALQQMAIDSSSSHLYEAQCASTKQVLEYNLPLTNSSTAAVAVTIADTCDDGIAIDPATNQLFVSSVDVNKIYAFNLPISNSSTPALTITTSNAGQRWPNIAFDASGNLYATDRGTNAIDVFVPPFSSTSNPAFSLAPAGIDNPWGLNVGPR